ncbi:MAG: hypothetical protein EXS39_06345 [Opitutaceae bacterium]|nr:hypothetical protein [Opitutaceae bacterium]
MRYRILLITLVTAGGLTTAVAGASGQTMPTRSIRVGDTLYVSGAGSLDPKTGKHPEGMAAATRQVLLNLKDYLGDHGFTFADVASSEVWISDLSKFAEMNKVYREVFSGDFPTRTTIEVSALAHGAEIEIAMVAVKGNRRIIRPKGTKSLNLPYSPGILTGDTLFIAGQASVDPQTAKLIEGDIKAHVTQTLKNIEAILQAADLDFSNVVQANVFLTNPADFDSVTEVYQSLTKLPCPARLPLGASKLPLNAPVEITVLAKLHPGRAIRPLGEDYSGGVLVDHELYLTGIGSAKESVQAQVDDCMSQLKQLVKVAGMSQENVVLARIYLSDINNVQAVNNAFLKYFAAGKPPTQATMAVAKLPANFRIITHFVAAKEKK